MKIVIVGYGSVSSALLPLLASELRNEISSLKIIAPCIQNKCTHEHGLTIVWCTETLTRENYKSILNDLDEDTFLINLSVDVASLPLVLLCHEKGALYLDTCIEPWAGEYTDNKIDLRHRTNYSLRESLLAKKKILRNGPTAVIAHGANPGLVSHFVKQALLNLRRELHSPHDPVPVTRQEWARLAWQLNIKAIHIAEHDTQASKHVKAPGEFVNTWSVAGFIGEACQPSELGWGTHEVKLPAEAVFHNPATKKTIYLNRPGASVRLKTWTPAYGPSLGFLITHNESISLADYLTYNISSEKHYRPTVAYAYHPCNDAILSIHELNGNSLRPQQQHRVLQGHDIIGGADYLGVLLMGHEKNAYWYGSVLKNSIAQSLSPASSATTLQVAAGVLAGVKWALKHPRQGIVESEEMDFHFILGVAHRYLGDMVGTYTDWNPTNINGPFFSCDADMGDVWQFANFLE
ncbi:homospermidine synthase [Pseudomonas sp. AFG_SD02_1510_Pfu_092]|uniref:saccharopine dehydrogenase C-terminal domain-containing protein n=1 Tax=Pseudomonas sp. AFG_SD02_1510_Pfu_092 TaxID=2259497 RepID=UPI000DEFB9CA|nr:saccharopine dehydrogenase C-terminal domain-containing protein [Pseudomonas sp. AFG_SD02_1510_Pfu_092]RCL24831.1 homospermidine synthase [Pseudomonas sp. AFG_SD02_1510_Pfu_092]